jgi:hypothetical protein
MAEDTGHYTASGKVYSIGLHILSRGLLYDFSYLISLYIHLLPIMTTFFRPVHIHGIMVSISSTKRNLFNTQAMKS